MKILERLKKLIPKTKENKYLLIGLLLLIVFLWWTRWEYHVFPHPGDSGDYLAMIRIHRITGNVEGYIIENRKVYHIKKNGDIIEDYFW